MRMKKSGFLAGFFASIGPVISDANYRVLYTVPAGVDIAIVTVVCNDYQARFSINGLPMTWMNGCYRNIYLKAGDILYFSKFSSTANYFNVTVWGEEFQMDSGDNPYIAVSATSTNTAWSLVYQNPNTWSHLIYPLVQVRTDFYVNDPNNARFYCSVDRALTSGLFDSKILIPPNSSLFAKASTTSGSDYGNMRLQGIQLP